MSNPRNDAAILCSNNDGEPVSALDMGDGFCTRCFIRAWNQGAAWADAHWADTPKPTIEMSPMGELYATDDRYMNPNAIYARDKARSNKGDL